MVEPSHERYLSRIGLDPSRVRTDAPDLRTLERLQRAHVATVPFETLAITGDPFGDRSGEGVSLAVADLYEKIVERRRGGFCYELNGLFGWLLGELGFDVDRIAGGMLDDGDLTLPASHRSHVVSLDRRYVVDVGLGIPVMRRPTPLDGSARADAAGVEWRIVESDRPDADYVTQYRRPGDEAWSRRYVFRDEPRGPRFDEAVCEYLAAAPESPFTGDPVVTAATPEGHARLTPETFTRIADGEERERTVAESEWHDVLAREFGVRYGPPAREE